MTKGELAVLVRELNLVFDIVRLVDVTLTKQFSVDDKGELTAQPYRCFGVWNKKRRCENCISAKAFLKRKRMTKFEFIGHEVYHVTAMYIEVEDVPYVLEMVARITDEALFGAYGKSEFVEAITRYNKKLYTDPLTGVYNRRYYEDQLSGLPGHCKVAMLDVDDFKNINDTYGHLAGDMALRAVAVAISFYIRETDAVIRYGGDEFLIIFQEITTKAFAERLEAVRKTVSETKLDEYEGMQLSVSIGGARCRSSISDAVREADRMLYKAKATKNEVWLEAEDEKD